MSLIAVGGIAEWKQSWTRPSRVFCALSGEFSRNEFVFYSVRPHQKWHQNTSAWVRSIKTAQFRVDFSKGERRRIQIRRVRICWNTPKFSRFNKFNIIFIRLSVSIWKIFLKSCWNLFKIVALTAFICYNIIALRLIYYSTFYVICQWFNGLPPSPRY